MENIIVIAAFNAYKKASKVSRAKVLKKFKCSTEEEFYKLCGVEYPKKEELKTVHNVHIIDVSGSMAGGKIVAAQKGVNDEIEELRKNSDVKFTQTIVTFSAGADSLKELCWKVDIGKAQPVNLYARGGTALRDAMGEILSRLRRENKGTTDHVLVKIFTDGEENSSMTWKPGEIKKLIEECESENFTITFVGTKQDINTVVRDYDIKSSNTFAHDNTVASLEHMSDERALATVSYAKKLRRGEEVKENFFTKQIKKS